MKQDRLEEVDSCPVCQGETFEPALKAIDHLVSRETFNIVRCHTCGLLLTTPRPVLSAISGYYQSDDYISHSSSSKGIVNRLYLLARKYTLRRKTGLVKKTAPGAKSLLDYGSGTGDFLAAAGESGYRITGIEPDQTARKVATRTHGLELLDPGALHSMPAASFDVITLWHVLEHIHELDQTVKAFSRLLRPGGVLVAAVPNASSMDASWYGPGWAAWDVPRHLYHFTLEPVKKLFANHQMQFVKAKPMYLDGFYIAMLSEKYRHSPWWLVKSACTGLMFFIRSVLRKDMASARTYIFKKSGQAVTGAV